LNAAIDEANSCNRIRFVAHDILRRHGLVREMNELIEAERPERKLSQYADELWQELRAKI
jgi:hypothetical protein